MLAVLVGFMIAAWIFTLAGTAYAVWRYVYGPWKVMRTDISALQQSVHSRLSALETEQQLRKVMTIDPELEYRTEVRAATRRAVREG